MHRTAKIASRIGASAAIAAVALIATAAAANAATVNPDGSGFVGKGEVQSAYGMNNAKMQAAVASGTITFSTSQAATQTLSQSANQNVTQDVTQDFHRVLSCTVDGKNKHFDAYGEREGSRTGGRDGEREGTLRGSLKGSLVSDIAYENKKTGQYTGWYLKGFADGSPVFGSTGAEEWNTEAQYGEVDYSGGVTTLGDITWGGWESAPGENPNDCLRNDTINGVPVVSDLYDHTDEGELEYGTEHFNAEHFRPTEYGDVTPEGAASLFVTYGGSTNPLTITVPAA
jgi:hypothetical protein